MPNHCPVATSSRPDPWPSAPWPSAAAPASTAPPACRKRPKSSFPPDLTAAGLLKAYAQINHGIGGMVAIKLHTGEPNGPNILPLDMVKALQQTIPDSSLVETNTLYKGKRFSTAAHRETIRINGWDFCPVDIIDEDGAVLIPVVGRRRFTEMSVGQHMLTAAEARSSICGR